MELVLFFLIGAFMVWKCLFPARGGQAGCGEVALLLMAALWLESRSCSQTPEDLWILLGLTPWTERAALLPIPRHPLGQLLPSRDPCSKKPCCGAGGSFTKPRKAWGGGVTG